MKDELNDDVVANELPRGQKASLGKRRVIAAITGASALFAVLVSPAAASNEDHRSCPPGWQLQPVARSTAGHERWDANGDGLICSKGNETLPGNEGPPNGHGNTHVGSEDTDGHNHKDNNNA